MLLHLLRHDQLLQDPNSAQTKGVNGESWQAAVNLRVSLGQVILNVRPQKCRATSCRFSRVVALLMPLAPFHHWVACADTCLAAGAAFRWRLERAGCFWTGGAHKAASCFGVRQQYQIAQPHCATVPATLAYAFASFQSCAYHALGILIVFLVGGGGEWEASTPTKTSAQGM